MQTFEVFPFLVVGVKRVSGKGFYPALSADNPQKENELYGSFIVHDNASLNCVSNSLGNSLFQWTCTVKKQLPKHI